MSEYQQNMDIVQATKMTKYPSPEFLIELSHVVITK